MNFKVNYNALAASYVHQYNCADTEEEKERILLAIADEDLAVIEEFIKGFKRES